MKFFGGSNRKKSMVWGLIIPVCRICHQEWKENKRLRNVFQKQAQKIFENTYGHELFMQEFKKNYL